ncbi:MAG: hypothetical protein HY329_10960, partial [Chloroflexi bacterium]|nr:hypothetical protein [Chloroflexota bacterium]
SRLAPRLNGLPDDATLRAHLEQLTGPTLHTLLVSGAWDTGNVGGEEVDVEWLLAEPEAPVAPQPEPRRVPAWVTPAEPVEPYKTELVLSSR